MDCALPLNRYRFRGTSGKNITLNLYSLLRLNYGVRGAEVPSQLSATRSTNSRPTPAGRGVRSEGETVDSRLARRLSGLERPAKLEASLQRGLRSKTTSWKAFGGESSTLKSPMDGTRSSGRTSMALLWCEDQAP